MKIAVFSAKRYDREFLTPANAQAGHHLRFSDAPLDDDSVGVAAGYDAVCIFVNDKADAEVLAQLNAGGTGLVPALHRLQQCRPEGRRSGSWATAPVFSCV